MKTAVLLTSAFFAVISCSGGSGGGGSSGVDREAALVFYADQVVIPGYQIFADKAAAYSAATKELCASPNDVRLQAAQKAWKGAITAWDETEAYAFGPVKTARYDSIIHFWPRRDDKIAEFIAANPAIDKSKVSAGGALTRGFLVGEYLLWAKADEPARVSSDFKDGGLGRCDYLAAAAELLVDDAAALLTSWKPGGGDFRKLFITAGKGSATYLKQAQAYDALINALLSSMRTLEDMKIARPSGKRDGGSPRPNDVEAPRADFSLELARANLTSARAVFLGGGDTAHPESIAASVALINADISASVLDQFGKSLAALQAVPGPLRTAVTTNPAEVEALFNEVRALVRLLSVDVAAALGVTPTFSDNDGD